MCWVLSLFKAPSCFHMAETAVHSLGECLPPCCKTYIPSLLGPLTHLLYDLFFNFRFFYFYFFCQLVSIIIFFSVPLSVNFTLDPDHGNVGFATGRQSGELIFSDNCDNETIFTYINFVCSDASEWDPDDENITVYLESSKWFFEIPCGVSFYSLYRKETGFCLEGGRQEYVPPPPPRPQISPDKTLRDISLISSH